LFLPLKGIALVLWALNNVKKLIATILDFAKNVLPPFEPKLLVMLERIGIVLQIVCEVLYTIAPIGQALESGQHITVWR
jgi:hypothetical protein